MITNLVLQDTIERTYHADTFGEVYRGMFVVRGENVVLLGEVDDEKDLRVTGEMLREVPADEVVRNARAEADRRKKRDALRCKVLHERGFSVDGGEAHDHY
ncbi:SM-like, degradation of cytoplasmic mRNAs and positively regulates transcription initiation [Irineochytrium annulatum]|nr:SM-like, degradation of cytoplasmic mRNAs and positively regulates transcription initiation [Irineochytrium annulatum]